MHCRGRILHGYHDSKSLLWNDRLLALYFSVKYRALRIPALEICRIELLGVNLRSLDRASSCLRAQRLELALPFANAHFFAKTNTEFCIDHGRLSGGSPSVLHQPSCFNSSFGEPIAQHLSIPISNYPALHAH